MAYCPDRGDIVWVEFSPQAGREIKDRHPALVITPKKYHQKSGLALVLPITSVAKGYPFEARLPAGGRIDGVVLADQIRSLDWQARNFQFIEKLPLDEVGALVDDYVAKLIQAN